MRKLTIEIQYDEDGEVGGLLNEALHGAEWARVSGDNRFTLIRGELQIPADHARHERAKAASFTRGGGCW